MNPKTLFAFVSSVALASQGFAQSTTVQGEPFGYVKVNITAGTGTTKKTTLLSIPLLDEANITGKSSGRITGLTANTITAEGAGWQPGQLSTAATPRLIEITSGEAQGRMLLISTTTANTSDTVTLASAEVPRVGDLTNLNIKVGAQDGDTYRIRPVHTLSSFFGTPESRGVQGGPSASSADTVILVDNGTARTYFFNTTLGRWTQVFTGSPDASSVPIAPFAGVQYSRLADTALELIVTGKVPSGQREASIKNSGATILSSFWPVGQTLAQLGLQNTPNWKTGASVGAADTVVLTTGGSTATYYHNGTSWIRSLVGGGNSDNVTVPVGTALLINKRGSAPDFASYEHSAPYNLQ